MKKYIFILLSMLSTQHFASAEVLLKCETGFNGYAYHAGVYGKIAAPCTDEYNHRDPYYIVVKSVGPGMDLSLNTHFFVKCPNLSYEELNEKKSIVFATAGISASAIYGGRVNLAGNIRAKMCSLVGINEGSVSVTLNFGYMKIGTGYLDELYDN